MKYEYETLEKKYSGFEQPVIELCVEGKTFDGEDTGLLIGEAQVSLSAGYEASQAVLRIYGCTSGETQEFLFDELRPYILLGSRISVRLGYKDAREEVFRGYIACVRFVSGEEPLPCVEVCAMDVKGALMTDIRECRLKAGDMGAAVREILARDRYRSMKEKGLLEKMKIADTPDAGAQRGDGPGRLALACESDYEFVVKAARRYGYEFFTEPGTLHFRKSREGAEDLLELKQGSAVLSLSASLDIRGVARQAEVRAADDEEGVLISAVKKCSDKLSYGSRVNGVLEGSGRVYSHVPVFSKEEAQVIAQARLACMADRFAALACTCVGIPELRPGNYVRVSGYGKGADNRYYITRADHILSGENGYITRLSGNARSVQ